MMNKIFTLYTPHIKNNAIHYMESLPLDGSHEVVFREVKANKTLKQLGGIFGCWEKCLSDREGRSIKEIHQELKKDFLVRIYQIEPQNDMQEQWVDLLEFYQLAGGEKLEKHKKRISLSWATLSQTREFMNDIEQHYIDIEEPLPILDPEWRKYSRSKNK